MDGAIENKIRHCVICEASGHASNEKTKLPDNFWDTLKC